MLSFPRRRRGKDNRQLYLVPDITSFILVCQRDNHNPDLAVYCSPAESVGTIRKNSHFVSSAIHIKIGSKTKERKKAERKTPFGFIIVISFRQVQ